MNKYFILFFALGLAVLIASCSHEEQLNVTDLEERLESLSSIEDDTIRKTEADSLWAQLSREDQIPFKEDSTVIFLFRGEAEQVSWNGDFNSWSGDDRFKNQGTNVEGTNIWMLKTTFPSDSRIDYKVTIDESWILDPINPYYQWSGFGPNSELRMPDWNPESLKERIPEAQNGTLYDNILLSSSNLGYGIQYQVYTPPGYDGLKDLPVIYILDGHEYSDDKLGAAVIMLDNLIHLKKINPVIAVFIDPRDPNDLDTNRRGEEFGTDQAYSDFIVNELIPETRSKFRISENRNRTALLGTSLGGLSTTYLGFKNPEVFGKLAIQAPAYWYKEKEIYGLVRGIKEADFDIYMSVGTISDNLNDARQMKKEFDRLDLDYTYVEVNEGHSWGAWSAQMDDILIQFFKK